tara:strand:- start:155 stop:565 length:411 start_codon:yes stop_codon:yes gene_type:complete
MFKLSLKHKRAIISILIILVIAIILKSTLFINYEFLETFTFNIKFKEGTDIKYSNFKFTYQDETKSSDDSGNIEFSAISPSSDYTIKITSDNQVVIDAFRNSTLKITSDNKGTSPIENGIQVTLDKHIKQIVMEHD